MGLCARDLMTRDVLTIREDADVGDAMSMLVEHGFRHLPVLRGRAPIGVLSDRDLRRFEGALAAEVEDTESDDERFSLPVAALLEPGEVVRCLPETPMRDVIDKMLSEHVSAVLVVDADEVLVGIVTTIDVLEAARDLL